MQTLHAWTQAPEINLAASASRVGSATHWVGLAGVTAALALVAWAGSEPRSSAPALECRISHPPGSGSATTVMLVNPGPQALPAGTVWAWAPAGGDPQRGEQRVLTQPLASGGAVRVESAVPAVALRCRAALVDAPAVAALSQPTGPGEAADWAGNDLGLSPR